MNESTIRRFIEETSARHARFHADAIGDMMVAKATRNQPAAADARRRLGEVIAESMGVGEVIGAGQVLRLASGAIAEENQSEQFRDRSRLVVFANQPMLPRVTLVEALDDLVLRTPVTIKNAAERTAQRIAELYGDGQVMAFVKSAEEAVTNRAQKLITEAFKRGLSTTDAGRSITMGVNEIRQESAAWTEGYSRMAFRTNVNTAITAGRFRQVQDPDIRGIIPAFRFDAVGDDDTRNNHGLLSGRIFAVDNTVWRRIAPPLGYNCRCRISEMTRPMLRRAGRLEKSGDIRQDSVPAGAGPDHGFRHGGRPDLFMLGAAR